MADRPATPRLPEPTCARSAPRVSVVAEGGDACDEDGSAGGATCSRASFVVLAAVATPGTADSTANATSVPGISTRAAAARGRLVGGDGGGLGVSSRLGDEVHGTTPSTAMTSSSPKNFASPVVVNSMHSTCTESSRPSHRQHGSASGSRKYRGFRCRATRARPSRFRTISSFHRIQYRYE